MDLFFLARQALTGGWIVQPDSARVNGILWSGGDLSHLRSTGPELSHSGRHPIPSRTNAKLLSCPMVLSALQIFNQKVVIGTNPGDPAVTEGDCGEWWPKHDHASR